MPRYFAVFVFSIISSKIKLKGNLIGTFVASFSTSSKTQLFVKRSQSTKLNEAKFIFLQRERAPREFLK